MISTKKEKALMGCLIPNGMLLISEEVEDVKGQGWRYPENCTEERKEGKHTDHRNRNDENREKANKESRSQTKKRNRCVPKGSIASNLQSARRALQQKKKEKAQLSAQSAPERLHVRSAPRKKSSVRLRRSSKRNLEKFPLEKCPLSKKFRIALLLSHKNCESLYTACYDWIIFSLVTFLPCLSDRSQD